MSDLMTLTPDNVEAILPDVPRLVRLALTFAARLRRGTLDIALPDGRVVRCGGLEPGPAAQMTVHDYRFAWRLARGGDQSPRRNRAGERLRPGHHSPGSGPVDRLAGTAFGTRS